MKNKSLLFATALLLLPAAGALAADDADVSGSLELGIRAVDNQDNSAKYTEYRDIDDGMLGNLLLQYFAGSYYLGVEGENIGLKDQSYLMEGGSYGNFKYSLFYNEIPHNLSFDAKTFYAGIGTNFLTIGLAEPDNEAAWTNFDYEVHRKQYGADVEVSMGSPFYVNVGVNREEKNGLKPLGSGEFSGQIEMPEPVDYETNNLTVAGGYRSSEIMFRVTGMLSDFDNSNDFLSWTNPGSGEDEINSLPPDNTYGKIAAHLTWRNLPMMSTLLVNGSYSNLSNDISVTDLFAAGPAGLNRMNFDGDISYTNFSASFVTRPTDDLDARLFYYYLDKENDSSVISYTGDSNATDLFDYTKHNAGLDVGYDLGMDTKLSGGYEYLNIDRRNRPDVASNTDNKLFVKVKNTSMDMLTAKLEYTYLNRDADQEFDLAGVTNTDPEFIEQFVKRFDHTSKSQHKVKLGLDIYPMDNFDVGLEYAYVYNDYDEVVLGRTEDKGHELYLDMMWRITEMFNLSGFAGYEKYKADSNHYNFRAGFQGQTADPTVPDFSTASYLWTRKINDDFWTVGLMGQLKTMQDRLHLSLSCQYQESDGQVDFWTDRATPLTDIDKSEDYKITTVEAKALYNLAQNLDLVLGYVYEKSEYEDLQYLGYEYQPPGSYLTGAYADYDYETHLGYLSMKYKF